YIECALYMHPLSKLCRNARRVEGLENTATYEMLVSGGVQDENEVDASGESYDMEALAQAENEQAMKLLEEEQTQEQVVVQEPVSAGTIYSLEELSDFDFLFSNFYTMETNTMITPEELNAEILLAKDMGIDKEVDGPQILIYHTHSQEGFVDSVPGDNSTTIVGVGALNHLAHQLYGRIVLATIS
ncbi:MAG: stage II sporulation protein P, partial [Prevotella sp.]|nr:stage II sporulation protein P [Prevotella sp.]